MLSCVELRFVKSFRFGCSLDTCATFAVRELVNRGCNPNTGSGTGETALHTMAAHGQVDCAKAFKAHCGHELMIEPRDKVTLSR